MLETCGAVYRNREGRHQLTPQGVRMAQMPLHPRLAHMLLVGCDINARETACLVAAILSERNPVSGHGVDLAHSLALLKGDTQCPLQLQGWFKRIWQQARNLARLGLDNKVRKSGRPTMGSPAGEVLGILLASAYPDRIARLRDGGDGTGYLMSNGRSAALPEDDSLRGTAWLAVAEIGGQAGEATDRIYSATRLDPEGFKGILSHLVREDELVKWDYQAEQFVA